MQKRRMSVVVNRNSMRKLPLLISAIIPILVSAVLLLSCQPSADDKAAALMARIDSLYEAQDYKAALNAITKLRADHPKAVESRKRAIEIWQDASLKIAQADLARTDSALQAAKKEFDAATTIAQRNQTGVKRDSLQVRYDALCGTIRVIHRRQAEK